MDEIKLKQTGAAFLYSPISENDLFTPEDLTEEHRMILATAKQFAEKDVKPNNEAYRSTGFRPCGNVIAPGR